jgi:hypothetical protein
MGVSVTGCTTEAKLLTLFSFLYKSIMGESLSPSFTFLPQMKENIKKLYNNLFIVRITNINIFIIY